MTHPSDALFSLARDFTLKKAKKIAREPIPKIPAAQKITLRAPDGGGFTAGFAVRDITPKNYRTHPYWMAGYGIAKRITGVLDPLTASAMWLGCGDEGIVLVSCDLIGLTGYEVKEIRDALAPFCAESGCRHITVSCTHTHAGADTMGYWGPLPRSGKNKAYMRFIKQTVAALCEEAYRDRRPGRLFYGSAEAPELLHRWRAPYYTQALLHRFRFVPDDGTDETWILNFPAHPNTMGGKNTLISADYPCYMRREIWRKQKVNVMYAVSAIGATDIGEIGEDGTERTILAGALLGKKALEIENERPLDPVITVISQPFVMPLDNFVLLLANTLGVFSARKCAADSATGAGFISEVTYLGIGDTQILTMPGEMFPELVWAGGYEGADTSATGEDANVNPTPLSEIFGNDRLMVFGVTNDMAGYALAKNDFVLDERMPCLQRARDRFGRSHYHETNSCGVNTGSVIAETCERIKGVLDANGR